MRLEDLDFDDLAFGGSGQISPDYRICTALLYEDLNGFVCIWINRFFGVGFNRFGWICVICGYGQNSMDSVGFG